MTRKPISSAAAKPGTIARKREAAVKSARLAPAAEERRLQKLQHPSTAVSAVIERAAHMGLMMANTRQVGARLPIALLRQAKKRTGIASTTELLEFALANVAVDDEFATAFVAARGQLDSEVDVGL